MEEPTARLYAEREDGESPKRMDSVERDRLSKVNYRRFLDKWRDRKDLLVAHR
jgi:hypothetical protein